MTNSISEHIKKYKLYLGLECTTMVIVTGLMILMHTPHYLVFFADVSFGLLFLIVHLNLQAMETASRKGNFLTPCENNRVYHAYARSTYGEKVVSYHPMQNLKATDEMSPDELNEMKAVYDLIRNERIKDYEWFVEIKTPKQMRALVSRIQYIVANYEDLLRNRNIPIWVHVCDDEEQVFPFHFQLTLGMTYEEQNLLFGAAKEVAVEQGVLYRKGGRVWHIFGTAYDLIKERFGNNWLIRPRLINMKYLRELCKMYGVDMPVNIPNDVQKWK